MAKARLDDHEAVSHLVKERVEEEKAIAASNEKKNEPAYFLDSDGLLCRTKATKDGKVTVRLCNFKASISEENVIDDGSGEVTHLYTIEGKLRGKVPLPKQEVPASNFAGMSWVHKWGTKAILEPGQTVKDYVRHAIQTASTNVKTMTHFGHTGWREVDGNMVYLHADGALGSDSEISVRLSKELQRYRFPAPPQDASQTKNCLAASLDLLDIGDRAITLPLWCGTYLAPLVSLLKQKPNFSFFAYGHSGTYKSTVAILFLSHFGQFNGIECLSNLDDTIGILEKRSFILADTLHVVDDFHPSHQKSDAQASERIVQRLIRNYSNRTARGRLNSDLSEKGRYDPRGMLLITAEELPTLESTLARIAVIEFTERAIDKVKLTELQEKAPLLSQAMSLYILWIKENMKAIQAAFPERFQALRTQAAADGQHRKMPEQAAFLGFALETAVSFFADKKILSDSEAGILVKEGWGVFAKLAVSQMRRIQDDDPVQLFTDIISALVMQHNARLDCTSAAEGGMLGAGDRIGWWDSSYLYLCPTAAWHALQRFVVQEQGHFPFSKNTFFRMLRNRKIIAGSGDENTVVVWIDGQSRRVLKIIDRGVYEKTVRTVRP